MTVAFAVAVLLAAVSVKYVSTMRLWSRYGPDEFVSSPQARRLFLAGKITPIIACAALVLLSYFTGLIWLVIPAWLLFGVIVLGVARIVHREFDAK
ncbi:MAG TPA: hypothetical protein VKT72_10755 [Candidatus Baltobacteraceae bacterium]|nr:hypothetical protein [Candidatus Baltobacteraceae bacterium]